MSKNMKKTVKYLVWFIVGQIAQLVLALVAKVSYMDRPILFCMAAGFLLTVAICAGVRLAKSEEPRSMTYLDYAKEEGYK